MSRNDMGQLLRESLRVRQVPVSRLRTVRGDPPVDALASRGHSARVDRLAWARVAVPASGSIRCCSARSRRRLVLDFCG